MSWILRYAPHLGFRSLEMPLFPASAGSADPLAQISFIASLGFAGVQDPWFATRPEPTQLRMISALSEFGLAAGCAACGTLSPIRTPPWNTPGPTARAHHEMAFLPAIAASPPICAQTACLLP